MYTDITNKNDSSMHFEGARSFNVRVENCRYRRWHFKLRLTIFVVTSLLASSLMAAQLRAIAVLPAASFVSGPASGHLIEAANGVLPPFAGQPLQGFSDILFYQQQWLAIGDNGFGSKQNSADHLLMVFSLSPGWKSASGGSGVLVGKLHFALTDPFRKVPFKIIAEMEHYPGSEVKVDPIIKARRLLTGADFDIESFRIAADGSYWFGDEFGPFLLRTNSKGELLEAPIELPGLWSPNNPLRDPAAALVQRSGGFESLVFSKDGSALVALLEKPLKNSEASTLNAYRFDLQTKKFSGLAWQYHLHASQNRVGAAGETSTDDLVLIERDRQQGEKAAYKKVFLFNPETGASREIADLLSLDDPHNLVGMGAVFRYPFSTIESVVMPDPQTLVIVNDNNYPFSVGRHSDKPDDTELIVVRVE